MTIDGRRTGAALALGGGFLSVFYVFHYMQVLSYSLGAYAEAATLIDANSINATSSMLAIISGSSSLRLALYLTYAMLPFALVMLAVGMLWFFAKAYSKLTGAVLLLSSAAYLLTVAVLENNITFHSTPLGLSIVCLSGVMAIIAGAQAFGLFSGAAPDTRRRAVQIGIDPEMPYTNMQILSNRLMGRLSGEVKILDMHFDVNALDNLARLTSKNTDKYTKICILSKRDRLGDKFSSAYKDFKDELLARRIEFELRVLTEDDASKQHERLLLDGSEAYKIPPLNIINRKSEHITPVKLEEASQRFNELWTRSMKYENLGIGVGYKSSESQ